ncbi:MAG: hypothetical protein LBH41_02580 [Rickettsiales bacterium]|jgi:hypothetical protein|nr:hypothetical protein [Rickettsiales bacterium]
MTITAAGLCSEALCKIGARGIDSFDDQSAEAETAAATYPLVKRKLLSSFAWSFAMARADLARADGGDAQPCNASCEAACYRYALPSDFLRAAGTSPDFRHRIAGGALESRAEAVSLCYIADTDEANFPPLFAAALVSSLAAEFALSMLDDTARFNALQRQSLIELREARLADSQQGMPKKIKNFPLIDSRK